MLGEPSRIMRPWGPPFPLSTFAFLVMFGLLALSCASEPRSLLVAAPAAHAPLPLEPAPLSDFEPARYRLNADLSPEVVEPVPDSQAPPACVWTTSAWSGALRVTAETEAFATTEDGRQARVVIPAGDSS